jgi:ABC-2 type transport system ATP-binding protein
MQDTQAVVSIRELTKVYPGKQKITAIAGISLDVPEGSIFGLLGPNGAGKTTTISVCTTRALPSDGTVFIAGVDAVKQPAQARRFIGVVPQFNTLDRSLTAFENIYFHCLYFGMTSSQASRRSKELLERFKLAERAKALPGQLSGGMAQRLQLARAVAHSPRVLFLDEPSAGLDPQSRLALWEMIRDMRSHGITVVLTTHYMEEADQLCDQVAIIDHGKILVSDTPDALKKSLGGMRVFDLRLRVTADGLSEKLRTLPGINSVEATDSGLRVFANGRDGLLPQIVAAAGDENLRDLTFTEPTLETVFIKLTGRDLRE